ncbi:hypothetical protein RFM68_31190 [Mesorhizobium sp. MSK_1335]|uniref:DUF768 domain-containing protein n=1 Tax=Mesorhizobium montanum TaxID=3072323 RepID=A0ABU4ZWX9_9HYPH|nr:hypothetical protein [Mesorhizobium sp. MSK_1335]MDX8528942.1 hypothetical protein [Mesorhizobium sp. MSK_1335]
MNATKEFLRSWLEENVGNLPAETEVSVPMLAQQFEQDADAAGYGREVREQELGNIEDAIQQTLDRTGEANAGPEAYVGEENSLTPVIDALKAADPGRSGSSGGNANQQTGTLPEEEPAEGSRKTVNHELERQRQSADSKDPKSGREALRDQVEEETELPQKVSA